MDFIQKIDKMNFPIVDQKTLMKLYEEYQKISSGNLDLEVAKKRTLGFGKYKGLSLQEVCESDKKYLEYLYSENQFLKDKAITLRSQIGLVLELCH